LPREPETLRELREAIIERGEGSLRDDATALLLEWRRGTRADAPPGNRLTRERWRRRHAVSPWLRRRPSPGHRTAFWCDC
jgi:hypothetical protein